MGGMKIHHRIGKREGDALFGYWLAEALRILENSTAASKAQRP